MAVDPPRRLEMGEGVPTLPTGKGHEEHGHPNWQLPHPHETILTLERRYPDASRLKWVPLLVDRGR